MVHHIVMWKFKPEIEENKKEELKKAMEEKDSCKKHDCNNVKWEEDESDIQEK